MASANAAVRVGCRRLLDSAGEWGLLVGALGGKRVGEDAGDGRATRFNSVSRALGSVDRVSVAFEGAVAAGFGDGVVVTATTDPERFESIGDAAASLLDDVNLLRRKLGRPPGVTVVEPTARGIGHAHFALFDVTRRDLPSVHELHRYWWETRERDQQVDVQSIEFDGESWTWAGDSPGDAAGCPPRAYLGEGPESLVATARLDADDVLSVARAFRRRGDASVSPESVDALDAAVSDETGVDAGSVRRAAWYFGTGVKAATRPSRALRTAAETGEGPA